MDGRRDGWTDPLIAYRCVPNVTAVNNCGVIHFLRVNTYNMLDGEVTDCGKVQGKAGGRVNDAKDR